MHIIDILQILRFSAALLVVIYHTQPGADTTTNFEGLFSFIKSGGSGVDIFFVISGFIITLTVMRKKEFDPVGFTINRFFRIYPTYWVFITLAIILGYISYLFTGSSGTYETVNPRSLIVSYLLAPLPTQIYPVAWTLTLEISFYLIFCISFRLAGLWGVVISLIAWYALSRIIGPQLIASEASFIWFFHSIVLEFLYEVIIAWLWLTGRIKWPAGIFVIGCLAYAGAVGGLYEGFMVGREIKWGIPAALLIYGAVGLPWKAPRLAVLAGDSSYILYLMHPLVITTVKVLALQFFNIDIFESDIAAIVIIIFSVLVSMLLTHWIEVPYIRWYKRFAISLALRRGLRA
jgi:peptidoglycan/LPS O-acetylase OafA/YrhL